MSCGLQARDYISCGFDRADLVVAAGYDMVEYPPNFWNPNKDKSVIHIAETPAEVDSAYTPEVEILGDIRTSLEYLAELGTPRAQRPEVGALKEFIASQLAEYGQDSSFPLKPQKIIADLRRALNPSDVVVSDVGAHKIWIARLFPCFEPNTCIISNGFAAMGISLPGAIAAKLVLPDRRVVAFSGDGGFLMNLQELETAVRLNIQLVALVLTDKTYGLIHWKQMQRYGRATAVGWNDVDYPKIAEGFGARGFRIQAASELLPALHEALDYDGIAVIDCPVDLHENLALTETLGQLICPI
jgi:acetolactate synthase-1/2/3 large subunit